MDPIISRIQQELIAQEDPEIQRTSRRFFKEAPRKHTDRVFSHIMKHKRGMPRTALRYAIELMLKDLKAKAIKKRVEFQKCRVLITLVLRYPEGDIYCNS